MLPKYIKVKKEENEIRQDEFYYSIDFDQKRNLLDSIVEEELDRWKIYNQAFNKPEDNYISEEDQINLVKELTNRIVLKRMTPPVLATISYYYRIESLDSLSDIISDKVNLAIMALVIETNNMDINQ